ncbi:hypothetical protein [Helicobacter rodentium]|uniref:hypothetical protein n=1 Tax=Helicobacter rodentium TaxID=59617 RepID=UPI002354824C|nr:hypothetical protein [Helicobacter rodentium]
MLRKFFKFSRNDERPKHLLLRHCEARINEAIYNYAKSKSLQSLLNILRFYCCVFLNLALWIATNRVAILAMTQNKRSVCKIMDL